MTASTSGRLKVLTYNIHKGVCYFSRQLVLDELRTGIRQIDPDIVFLQEVRGHVDRAPTGRQFEFLASEIWPHFAYGKNAVYSRGHHGNAILSKFPIAFNDNVDISTSRFEKRGLLHATVQVPGLGSTHLFCIHLDLFELGRRQQVDLIARRISEHVDSQPMIMAGDFNDWRMRISDRLRHLLQMEEVGLALHGAHLKTFPSLLPVWSLDRIYYRGLNPTHHEVLKGTQWQKLSDHLAVTAEFRWP